jgi:hypothetical protein
VKWISSASSEKMLTVRVTTVSGQEVYFNQYQHHGKEFKTLIDLRGKAAGMYFLELSDGKNKSVKKLTIN